MDMGTKWVNVRVRGIYNDCIWWFLYVVRFCCCCNNINHMKTSEYKFHGVFFHRVNEKVAFHASGRGGNSTDIICCTICRMMNAYSFNKWKAFSVNIYENENFVQYLDCFFLEIDQTNNRKSDCEKYKQINKINYTRRDPFSCSNYNDAEYFFELINLTEVIPIEMSDNWKCFKRFLYLLL